MRTVAWRLAGPARAVARGPFTEGSLAACGTANIGVQLQQERQFSSPMFRSRNSSATSPWSGQLERQPGTANLTSTTSSLAATSAWQASVSNTESSQVEEWLAALHMVDDEARALCTGLLSRHPTLLWNDAQRTTGVVQALVDATRAKRLLRPYAMQDAHVLALVDRYTPETLRARLSELHRLVWQRLDESNVAALFTSRISLDVLDLDAKALALKALALRSLVPEFPPSTVLRACPELLDVQVDDLPGYVARAGDVVVIGRGVAAELVAARNAVIVRSRKEVVTASAAAAAVPPLAGAGAASAGRLLRTARCGATQLLQEQYMCQVGDGPRREAVRVFCNERQLIFASGGKMEVRVEDPGKTQDPQQEGQEQQRPREGATAYAMAVLQTPPAAGVANAGMRA